MPPGEQSHGWKYIPKNYATQDWNADDFGLRSPVIQKTYLPKSATSIVARLFSLTCFLSLTDRPPLCPFLLGVPCRLRSLAFQGYGSGF